MTLAALGEVVVGLLWDSQYTTLKLSYVASGLGLVIAFNVMWIYYNIGKHTFAHFCRARDMDEHQRGIHF